MERTPRVTKKSELHEGRGGNVDHHAHIGFPQHPTAAPGHIELPPLMLCVDGRMAPGKDTGLHEHRDDEIVSLVRRGRSRYRDDAGHDIELGRGSLVLASAGTGLSHQHQNESDGLVEIVELILTPSRIGADPSVELFALGEAFAPVPANTAQRPDVKIWWGRADRHEHQVAPGNSSYVAVLDGQIRIEGAALESGDRAVLDGGRWAMEGDAELLVLDLGG